MVYGIDCTMYPKGTLTNMEKKIFKHNPDIDEILELIKNADDNMEIDFKGKLEEAYNYSLLKRMGFSEEKINEILLELNK